MKILLLISVLIFSLFGLTQKYPFYDNYKWEKSPELNDRGLQDPVYYFNQYDVIVEYIYDKSRGTYNKYETSHYRVFLNSDAAVEEFNKIYISLKDVYNVLNLEARLIKKDGIEIIKPEIEEFYNEDENEEYYYFPVSGIEVGDEIEVIYTLKMAQFMNGDQFVFQNEYPIFNSSFYLIAPTYFKFAFETYNGFPKPKKMDTIIQVNHYYSHLDTISAFKNEYYSEYYNSIYKLDVSLHSIDENGYFERYYPYERTVKYMNDNYNLPIKKGVQKKIMQKMIAFGCNLSVNEEHNIRLIENYIKIKINFSSQFLDLGLLETLKLERTSAQGIIKLYKAFLDVLNIKYKYGYISERYETHFSENIESDYFLQNFIFYFPKTNKYLAPLDFSSRLGFISPDWVPNNALFVTETKVGVRKSNYAVKSVPAVGYVHNKDSTVLKIKLAENLVDMKIEVEVYLTGYEAGQLQAFYYLYSPEKKKKMAKEILNFMGDHSIYKVNEILNTNPEDAFVKPLIIKGEITQLYTHLMEQADKKTIFKLGNVFGDGIELKEIVDRKTDYTFAFAFLSIKTVELFLPEGAKVTNLVNIQEFEDFIDLDGFSLSSTISVDNGKIVYVKKNAFKKQKYSIDEKEKMTKIFQFYNDIANMNVIIEK
jgi:hypothetical protein